jgi:hypothetical protein
MDPALSAALKVVPVLRRLDSVERFFLKRKLNVPVKTEGEYAFLRLSSYRPERRKSSSRIPRMSSTGKSSTVDRISYVSWASTRMTTVS